MKNNYPLQISNYKGQAITRSCDKQRTKRITFVLVLGFICALSVNANVTVTAPSANISADKAANATSPAWTTLGNIVITEGANKDFADNQTNATLILTRPTNWSFNPGVGSVSNSTSGGDVTGLSLTVTSTTITMQFTSKNNGNKIDVITISGIQIRSDNGADLPSSGNILRTAGNPGSGTIVGIVNGTTNFGSLSQTFGATNKIVVTLPNQSFTDGSTVAGSGNTGIVSTQVAGISFIISKLTATDQFFNIITSYAGGKTISYSGPAGSPTYTTGVSFTSGQSTTTLTTTLTKAETTTITASDGTYGGPASSSLLVNPGVLNNFLVEESGGGNIGTKSNGIPFSIQITARDANNNILSSGPNIFTGTANITSTGTLTLGGGATLPFVAGFLAAHSVIISNTGNFTITATNGGASGTSNLFLVTNAKTSATSGNWNTAGTWFPPGVPLSGHNINILFGHTVTVDAPGGTCYYLLIDPGAALTVSAGQTLSVGGNLDIMSLSTATGSLIINGTLSISGYTSVYPWMSGNLPGAINNWHIISAPVSGQGILPFIIASGLASNAGLGVWALGVYDEHNNYWSYLPLTYSNATATFPMGVGYVIARNVPDGPVVFTGAPVTSDVSVPIKQSIFKFGWNSVGNPFTSAIRIGGSNSFLGDNLSELDPSYTAAYLWDPASSTYTTLNNMAGNNVQVGQGFIVRSNPGNHTVTFKTSHQLHSTGTVFKTGQDPWPEIEIKAAITGLSRTTLISFNSSMTLGLDPSFDAGLFKSGGGLELLTRLVEDNGVDFAIQCLPDNGFDKMVIPIGIDLTVGGEVTFTAKLMNLPLDCKPVLEDKQTGIFTDLFAEGASYKAQVPSNTKGIGRFFLHFANTSGIQDLAADIYKVYAVGREIHIQGVVNAHSLVSLFDLSGKEVGLFKLDPGTENVIHPEGITNGIYMLVISENGTRNFTGKINLGN